MAFARWDPVRDMRAVRRHLNRFAPGASAWVPAIDVHETVDDYVVTAEIPGVNREDIQVSVANGTLQLSGVRREANVPCEQYHRVERGHGPFNRTFQLPLPVDHERVTADLRDGVLTVICPKTTDGTTRRIQVG